MSILMDSRKSICHIQMKLTQLLFSLAMLFIFSGDILANEIEMKEKPGNGKNKFAYKNGFIQYKSGYTLYVYPPFHTLQENNRYIQDIYSSILLDQLQLNRIIYVKDPAPIAIFYPDDLKEEDPFDNFMDGELPVPPFFDFEAKMIYDFPPSIKEPAMILKNPDLARFFLPEDLYLVSSIEQGIENRNEIYIIHVWIYRNGKLLYAQNITTNENDISRKIISFAREISTHITGAETGSLNVTSNIDRASVYLNDRYMGYTPLLIENAVIGANSVEIRKEDYVTWRSKVIISKQGTTEVTATLEKIQSDNRITVISSPEKCDVFFDVQYKGQTPLVIENVTSGTHRIHLQKPGFIDFFKTVEVETGRHEYDVSARLAPGDAKNFYDINRGIIGPLSYEQLFKISALITSVSGLTGLFSQVQSENLQNTLTQYQNSKGSNLTSAEIKIINKQKSEIELYKGLQTGFYIGSGVFLAATIYLFIRYIGAQDMPISGIIDRTGYGSQVFLNINPEQNTFQFIFQRRL